jgi:putative methionine-R-sulfoxide reductase with GAF domain
VDTTAAAVTIAGVRSAGANEDDLGSWISAAVAHVVSSASEPVEQRAHQAAELIRASTGRRWVGIYRVGEQRVENLAWSGVGPPAHPIFGVDEGLTAAVIATKRTVVSNNVTADPRYLVNQATSGSELIVPILSDRVVGTLDVEDAANEAFAARDEQLFEQIATALLPLYERA